MKNLESGQVTKESEGAPASNRLLASGSSADVFQQQDGCVLKLYRSSVPLQVLESERRALTAAHLSGLPVPHVYRVVENEGRRGLLMDQVDGPTLLRRFTRRPWCALSLVRRMASLQASIHAVNAAGLGSARDRYLPGLNRAGLRNDISRQLLQRLAEAERAERLCHGDFHPSNVILSGNRLIVIDWEKAHSGPPALDVARTLALLLYGRRRQVAGGSVERYVRHRLADAYMRYYAKCAGTRRSTDVDWWLPVAIASKLPYVHEEMRTAMHSHIDRRLCASEKL